MPKTCQIRRLTGTFALKWHCSYRSWKELISAPNFVGWYRTLLLRPTSTVLVINGSSTSSPFSSTAYRMRTSRSSSSNRPPARRPGLLCESMFFMWEGKPRTASDIEDDVRCAWSTRDDQDSYRISVGLSLDPVFITEKKFSLVKNRLHGQKNNPTKSVYTF